MQYDDPQNYNKESCVKKIVTVYKLDPVSTYAKKRAA